MVILQNIQYNTNMTRNDRRTKNFFKILFCQLGVGLIMASLAVFILFFAQGYRFNYKSFRIIKTGIISVTSSPKNASVYINGKESSKKTPLAATLTSGVYLVEVKSSGYNSWHSYCKVQPELVTEFEKVVLFKENITTTSLEDPSKIELLNAPIDILAVRKDPLLTYNDYEIWQSGVLVTRFSEPVIKAVWYPDLEHILYQQNNEIHVIGIDGRNDNLLVTLEADTPSVFTTNSRGDELYFTDSGNYKWAKIR